MKKIFIIVSFILSSTCFARDGLQVSMLYGNDLELGQAVTSSYPVQRDILNESKGINLNYQISNYRFGIRYESLFSSYSYKDDSTSQDFDLTSRQSYYSGSFDYIFKETNFNIFYLTFRLGFGTYQLKSLETKNTIERDILMASAGAGWQHKLHKNAFLFGELFFRKSFLGELNLDGNNYRQYSLHGDYIPSYVIGLGYSF